MPYCAQKLTEHNVTGLIRRFTFFRGTLSNKFSVNWSLKIASFLKRVAALTIET